MKSLACTLAFLCAAVIGVGVASSAAAGPAAKPAHKASLVADMDCSGCHSPDGWKMSGVPSAGGGFDHSKTGFPLTGAHERTTCVGCHVPGREITRDCAGCHADSHEGRLGATCDGCHRATSWNETKVMEEHRRTRLPLTGMHALLDCTACHLRTGERAWSETPADCFACHEKDYRANTTHPSHVGNPAAAQPAFPRTCPECHTALGWTPAFLPAAFMGAAATAAPQSHERLFPIQAGKHRGFACEQCHERGPQGGSVDCRGCHEHSTLRLMSLHRGEPTPFDARACLHCHPGGAAR